LWRGSRHRDLSRKMLRSTLPRDSSPVTLSPFLSGTDTDDARTLQYSLPTLAFTFILYHSSRATSLPVVLDSPRLLLPPSIVHCTMLCLTRPRKRTYMHNVPTTRTVPSMHGVEYYMSTVAGFENRNSDRDDPSCSEEEEVRTLCAVRWPGGLRNGNVRNYSN
jgi:hypothetical protein